jgi:hypothetical protein
MPPRATLARAERRDGHVGHRAVGGVAERVDSGRALAGPVPQHGAGERRASQDLLDRRLLRPAAPAVPLDRLQVLPRALGDLRGGVVRRVSHRGERGRQVLVHHHLADPQGGVRRQLGLAALDDAGEPVERLGRLPVAGQLLGVLRHHLGRRALVRDVRGQGEHDQAHPALRGRMRQHADFSAHWTSPRT